ncbi:HutD family protein [Hydrogenophaga sp. 2FB]|uniref:HutD/Ves family protein n=1 Tax=Hydrogenophaga sp. 2FB TaxID=2502187 RepID=UPI0010F4F865|nr:HutD family protein [Hydrogenophaga sp. 2FB]
MNAPRLASVCAAPARLQRFSLADLPAMPWKNGGGTTREIACQPPGAGLGAFDWRVSIATIAAAGPFSAFPGVDRVIMLLDGAGVHLRGEGVDHRLDTPLTPFAFAGDVALACDLLGGTSTDFNLMTRRGKLRAEVRVWHAAGDIAAAPAGVLLTRGGAWQCTDDSGHTQHWQADSGVWWQGETPAWHVAPLDAGAALIAVHIETADR